MLRTGNSPDFFRKNPVPGKCHLGTRPLIFGCDQQSFKWHLHPSIHPSFHPSIHPGLYFLFCSTKFHPFNFIYLCLCIPALAYQSCFILFILFFEFYDEYIDIVPYFSWACLKRRHVYEVVWPSGRVEVWPKLTSADVYQCLRQWQRPQGQKPS